MKKLMVALVMACSFLLTACGGDNGELAGEYQEVKSFSGGLPDKWIIEYNKKDDTYTQTLLQPSLNGGYFKSVSNSGLKRNGDWLGDENSGSGHEKHFIKIIDKNTLQLRDDEKDIYKRIK